uniref:Uncharacterized protein n=1 Tax=Anguilla anguilla TaxID=7936 RepID=A0A0E9PYX2_ANGAN
MTTANPRFGAWIPVVSVNCSDPFASLFFCFRQSVYGDALRGTRVATVSSDHQWRLL